MKKIRVLFADDHKLIRAGLRLVAEKDPDILVVGEADDGVQAVATAQSLRPDVAVLDIGMPNTNGIEAARQIQDSLPQTRVIMLSMHSDETYVLRALRVGVRGYLLKDSAEADLVKAIQAHASSGSEGNLSVAAFNLLPDSSKQDLLNFLRSL